MGYDLQRCPECNNKEIKQGIAPFGESHGQFFFYCNCCGLSGPYDQLQSKAAEKWNRLARKERSLKYKGREIQSHSFVEVEDLNIPCKSCMGRPVLCELPEDYFFVRCKHCLTQSRVEKGKEAAIEMWKELNYIQEGYEIVKRVPEYLTQMKNTRCPACNVACTLRFDDNVKDKIRVTCSCCGFSGQFHEIEGDDTKQAAWESFVKLCKKLENNQL